MSHAFPPVFPPNPVASGPAIVHAITISIDPKNVVEGPTGPGAVAGPPHSGAPSASEAVGAPGVIASLRATYRWATRAYATDEDDPDMPNASFVDVVLDPGTVSRSVSLTPADGTGVVSTQSAVAIANADGAFDQTFDDYHLPGATVAVLAGRQGMPWATFRSIAVHEAASWDTDGLATLVINCRDATAVFDREMAINTYTGLGGLDGDAQVVNRVKPIALGRLINVTPVRIDSVSEIYQVHDGAIAAIEAVRDGGMPLTFGTFRADFDAMAATPPAPGSYDVCLAQGLIRVETPPVFTLTADVQGRADAGTRAVDIAQAIVAEVIGLSPFDLDTEAFASLAAEINPEAGLLIESPTTYRAVIDTFLGAIMAFWGVTHEGRLTVARLAPPEPSEAGAPTGEWSAEDMSPEDWAIYTALTHNLVAADIIAIDRVALPPGYETGHRSRSIRAARNWTPQSADQLAAAAPDATRWEREWDTVTVILQDPLHGAVKPPTLETPIFDPVDAAALGQRLLEMHGVARKMFVATVAMAGVVPGIGEQVRITYPRFGLQGGRTFRVIGTSASHAGGTIDMTLWG